MFLGRPLSWLLGLLSYEDCAYWGVSRVDFPEIYSPGVWVRGEGRFIGGLRFCLPLVSTVNSFEIGHLGKRW